VDSFRCFASCGVVRACTLQGRELCLGRCDVGPVTALAGVCLQNLERGAHEGCKRLLASRLRQVLGKATHPPTYLPLHSCRPAVSATFHCDRCEMRSAHSRCLVSRTLITTVSMARPDSRCRITHVWRAYIHIRAQSR